MKYAGLVYTGHAFVLVGLILVIAQFILRLIGIDPLGYSMLPIGILFFVLGNTLLLFRRRIKKEDAEERSAIEERENLATNNQGGPYSSQSLPEETPPSALLNQPYLSPSGSFSRTREGYEYQNVWLALSTSSSLGQVYNLILQGDEVFLEAASLNNQDPMAIRVVHRSGPIGYLHKSRLRELANEFLNRGDSITASIAHASFERGILVNLSLRRIDTAAE